MSETPANAPSNSEISDALRRLYQQCGSIDALAKTLGTTAWRARQLLIEFGVRLKSKGGPNYVKVQMTEELLDEVMSDGVTAVARRLGVNHTTIYGQLHRLKAQLKAEGEPE